MSRVFAAGQRMGGCGAAALAACIGGCMPMDDLSSYSSEGAPQTEVAGGAAFGNAATDVNRVVIAGRPDADVAASEPSEAASDAGSAPPDAGANTRLGAAAPAQDGPAAASSDRL